MAFHEEGEEGLRRHITRTGIMETGMSGAGAGAGATDTEVRYANGNGNGKIQ